MFAKIIDKNTKECEVGLGTDVNFYRSLGMEEMDVEEAYNHKWYVKGYAPNKPEPTLEEKVAKLEAETGLTRVIREMVLAESSGASEYVKAKAREIETLAEQLRTAEESSVTGKESLQVEEVVVSETENTVEKGEGW